MSSWKIVAGALVVIFTGWKFLDARTTVSAIAYVLVGYILIAAIVVIPA
jgi:hypothetical protein